MPHVDVAREYGEGSRGWIGLSSTYPNHTNIRNAYAPSLDTSFALSLDLPVSKRQQTAAFPAGLFEALPPDRGRISKRPSR